MLKFTCEERKLWAARDLGESPGLSSRRGSGESRCGHAPLQQLVGVNQTNGKSAAGRGKEPPVWLTQTESAAVTLSPPVLRRGRAARHLSAADSRDAGAGAAVEKEGRPRCASVLSPRGDAEEMWTV